MTQHAGVGARRLVEQLGLEAHPEGGWYRRSWTAATNDASSDGVRAAGSSILYLLGADVASRWHRIDATELWQHAAGAPLELARWAGGDDPVHHDTLGPDLLDGQVPQCVVDPGVWQSARSLGGWSLMTCVVVPEFRFEGFELAPSGWSPPGDDPRGQS